MQEFEANANSTADREQAVPAQAVAASIVGVETNLVAIEGSPNSPATVEFVSTSDAAATYVRRRWSPFAFSPEHGTALTWIVGVLSTFAFAAAVTSRGVEGYGSVAVESDGSPRFVIDVRSAEWTDFALLPGVGRTLAKRMVEARDSAGSDVRPATFETVRGVGPKTWRRIEPYLQFPKP